MIFSSLLSHLKRFRVLSPLYVLETGGARSLGFERSMRLWARNLVFGDV